MGSESNGLGFMGTMFAVACGIILAPVLLCGGCVGLFSGAVGSSGSRASTAPEPPLHPVSGKIAPPRPATAPPLFPTPEPPPVAAAGPPGPKAPFTTDLRTVDGRLFPDLLVIEENENGFRVVADRGAFYLAASDLPPDFVAAFRRTNPRLTREK